MRKGNIEFKWDDTNNSHELVKFKDELCYVVAFFTKGKEGYDMETVGERFFEDPDAWLVGKHAMAFLNECFEDEEE